MKELSPYRSNLIAKASKCFWANLLDYGMVLILSFLIIWCVGLPVYGSLPGVSQLESDMALAQSRSSEVIASTHLELYGEDLELLSEDEMGQAYVTTLAKTSFYLSDREYPNSDGSYSAVAYEDTFLNVGSEESPYPNDSLSYYFLHFKESAGNGIGSYVYDGVDYSSDKESYLYGIAMGYSDLSYFDESLDGDIPVYQKLSISWAQRIADYLVLSDRGGQSTYSYFLNAYLLASNSFIAEVEENYVPYIEAEALLEESTASYYRYLLIDVTVCYLVAFVLLELIPPLVFKGGKTIGIKSFRLAYSSHEETVPEWWRYLIKSAVRCPIYLSCIALCLMFMSGNTLGILFMDIGGGFAYVYLLMASLLLAIGSLIFSLSHKEHQGFAEGAAGLLVKDTELYEAEAPLDERRDDGRESSGTNA